MDTRFSLPTVSDERPTITNLPPYPDFTISLSGNDWRQAEFININKLRAVGEEVDEIIQILINHSKETDEGVRSFDHHHVRHMVGQADLFIPLFELKGLLRSHVVGSIAFDGHPGFVKNGFALHTLSATYYGQEENGVVKSLGVIGVGEGAAKEIRRIIKSFNLIFVQWCNCNIQTP